MDRDYRVLGKLEEVIKVHNELVGHIKHLSEWQTQSIQKQQIDAMKEVVAHAYSKATAYSNVIIIAGYVALFSIWSVMRDKLPGKAMFVVALLITLSAALFVLFEVFKMVASGIYFRKITKSLEGVGGPELISKIQQEGKRFELSVARVWIFVLVPTLFFGLAALGVLVYYFLVGIFKSGGLSGAVL
jgi:hypothetical protein